MNLPRIFANAIARRIAVVLVGLLFAFIGGCFGIGDALAQDSRVGGACPNNLDPRCDKATAYQQCRAAAALADADPNIGQSSKPTYCGDNAANARWQVRRADIGTVVGSTTTYITVQYYRPCDAGTEWNDETKTCFSCSFDDPPLGPGHMQCSGSTFDSCSYVACSGGCSYDQPGGGHDGYVIDGRMWVLTTGWMPRGEACTVGPSTPGLGVPPADSDGDGTSDGNDSSPNNPGSGGGGGQNGEGQPEDGSSACGGPDQPACESDGSNSGSGNGNTSGGGGNCQTPPSSTGDAILAQIAYQAWATRCAVEGLGEGGTGIAPGVGDGAKEGTLKGIKDFLDGKGQDVPEAEDPWMDGLPGEPSDWNLGLGGGSCPAPVSTSISFGGASAPIEFSFQPMCDLAGLLNTLFRALGALIAAYIIAGVRR